MMSFTNFRSVCLLALAGYLAAQPVRAELGLRSDVELQDYTANVHTGTGSALHFDVTPVTAAAQIDIADFWGETVAAGEMTPGSSTLTVPMLPEGFYRVRIMAADRILETGEFAIIGDRPAAAEATALFGIGTHLAQGWSEDVITLARAIGMSWIRDEAYWGIVEQRKGELDFLSDERMPRLRRSSERIHPILCLSYGNPFYDEDSAPHTPEGLAAWSAYVRGTVTHFPAIDTFEVWNEFNCGFNLKGVIAPTPQHYLALLRTSYEAVKAVRPTARVVGGATSTLPMQWIEELLQLGALQYLDAFSVHPYRWAEWHRPPETLYADLLALRQLIERYANGREIAILADEVGWPVDARYGISPDRQAAYAVRTFANLQRTGVETVIWYSFMKPPHDPEQFAVSVLTEHHRVLPRPGFQALNEMTRQLSGAVYLGEMSVPAPALALRYRRDRQELLLLWNSLGTPLTLALHTTAPLTVTDVMGTAHELTPVDGKVIAIVGDLPCYVAGTVTAITASDEFQLTPEGAEAIAATPFQFDWQAPAGSELELRGRTLEPGSFTVTAPEAGAGCSLRGILRRDGIACGIATLSVETQPRLRLDGIATTADGRLQLFLTDRAPNRTMTVTELEVKLDGVVQALPFALPVTLPAGAKQSFVLPLPAGEPYHLQRLELNLKTASGDLLRHEENIGFNPCFRRDDVTIDGDLSEWQGQPYIDLRRDGTAVALSSQGIRPEVNGKIWLGWNDTHFLLAAEIDDPLYRQCFPVWEGDSLQFGFSRAVPVDAATTVEVEAAFQEGGPSWIFDGKAPLGFDASAIRRYSHPAMRRAADRSCYEVAIPWDRLQFIQPADGAYRFSILNNENDGVRRTGFLQWGGGIGGNKDPAEYVLCTFVR